MPRRRRGAAGGAVTAAIRHQRRRRRRDDGLPAGGQWAVATLCSPASDVPPMPVPPAVPVPPTPSVWGHTEVAACCLAPACHERRCVLCARWAGSAAPDECVVACGERSATCGAVVCTECARVFHVACLERHFATRVVCSAEMVRAECRAPTLDPWRFAPPAERAHWRRLLEPVRPDVEWRQVLRDEGGFTLDDTTPWSAATHDPAVRELYTDACAAAARRRLRTHAYLRARAAGLVRAAVPHAAVPAQDVWRAWQECARPLRDARRRLLTPAHRAATLLDEPCVFCAYPTLLRAPDTDACTLDADLFPGFLLRDARLQRWRRELRVRHDEIVPVAPLDTSALPDRDTALPPPARLSAELRARLQHCVTAADTDAEVRHAATVLLDTTRRTVATQPYAAADTRYAATPGDTEYRVWWLGTPMPTRHADTMQDGVGEMRYHDRFCVCMLSLLVPADCVSDEDLLVRHGGFQAHWPWVAFDVDGRAYRVPWSLVERWTATMVPGPFVDAREDQRRAGVREGVGVNAARRCTVDNAHTCWVPLTSPRRFERLRALLHFLAHEARAGHAPPCVEDTDALLGTALLPPALRVGWRPPPPPVAHEDAGHE